MFLQSIAFAVRLEKNDGGGWGANDAAEWYHRPTFSAGMTEKPNRLHPAFCVRKPLSFQSSPVQTFKANFVFP